MKTTILAIALSTVFALPVFASQAVPPRACPTGLGFKPLDPTYPAHALVLGWSPVATGQPDRTRFYHQLLQILKEERPDLILQYLTPTYAMSTAGSDLNTKLAYSGKIQLIETKADIPWPQDMMVLGGVRSANNTPFRPTALNFPENDQHPEYRPATNSYAAATKMLVMNGLREQSGPDEFPNNLGGNIVAFPGGVVAIGSGISSQVESVLKGQGLVVKRVASQRLPNGGHVDEMFAVIPANNQCGFSILYNSPKKAIDIAKASNNKNQIFGGIKGIMGGNHETQPCIAWFGQRMQEEGYKKGNTFQNVLECSEMRDAMSELDSDIRDDLKQITRAVTHRTGCRDVDVIPLPVLYGARPKFHSTGGSYGYNLDTLADLNINPVNGITLDKLFITPHQVSPDFEIYIKGEIEKRGVKVRFVNADSLNLNKAPGGVHCATNVMRVCQ
jgi:hypothetical protein